MRKNFVHDRMAPLFSALGAVVVLALAVSGCDFFSGGGEEAATSKAPAPIELVEGMKYYVGGPVLQPDQYGRMRIKTFAGEVKKPTSRGLVIGFKDLEGKRFEMRTWINGRPVTKQYGFVGQAGLLWYDERSTLNSDGVAIVTERNTYDDGAAIMHSKVDYFDPADGQVIKTYEADIPYAPDDQDEDEDAEDDAAEKQ